MMAVAKICCIVFLASSGTLVAGLTPKSDAPEHINKHDLWAINDMLVVGYACPTCTSSTAVPTPPASTKAAVQAAVIKFALLLPELHPVADCRKEFAVAVAGTPVENQDATFINKMASISRSCIVGGPVNCDGAKWFCRVADVHTGPGPWTQGGATSNPDNCCRAGRFGLGHWPICSSCGGGKAAPVTKCIGSSLVCKANDRRLQANDQGYEQHPAAAFSSQPDWVTPSACRKPDNTLWPRACSFWSSLHTMSMRADAMGKEFELVASIAPTIASGALLCNGCVKHYMLYMKDLWATNPAYKVFAEISTSYSGTPGIKCFDQCGEAFAHVNHFMCASSKYSETCVIDNDYKDEQTDTAAFQHLIATSVANKKLAYPLFSLVVVHHNLVTYGVDRKFLNPQPAGRGRRLGSPPSDKGKTFYTPRAACESLKKSVLWPDISADVKLPVPDCCTKTPAAVPDFGWSLVATPWLAGACLTPAPTAPLAAVNPCATAPCAPVVNPVTATPLPNANPCTTAAPTAAVNLAVNPCATAPCAPVVNPVTAAPLPNANPCTTAAPTAPLAVTMAANPCTTQVMRLYSVQEQGVQKAVGAAQKDSNASQTWVVPVLGMFALFALIAGVGASVYKKARPTYTRLLTPTESDVPESALE